MEEKRDDIKLASCHIATTMGIRVPPRRTKKVPKNKATVLRKSMKFSEYMSNKTNLNY